MTVWDPYANAYNLAWRNMSTWNKDERNLGRGGWVGTRNFELVGAGGKGVAGVEGGGSGWG